MNGKKIFRMIILIFIAVSYFSPEVTSFKLFGLSTPMAIAIASSIIFLIISIKTQGRKQTQERVVTANCPDCGSSLQPWEKICTNCGVEVDKEVVCDYCGTLNSPADLMCKKCNGLLK